MKRALLVGALVSLTACHHWVVVRGQSPDAARSATRYSPADLRVERNGGDVVGLAKAHVEGDSLIGLAKKTRVAIPLDDIRTIERAELHPGKMIGVGAVALVGGFLVFITVIVLFDARLWP